MTGDGAHEGVPPGWAYVQVIEARGRTRADLKRTAALQAGMRTQPFPDPAEVLAWIMLAPGQSATYDDAARIVAFELRRFLEPLAWEDWRAREVMTRWKAQDPSGFRRAMARAGGPTLFQFGWALNALRWAYCLPPVENPAMPSDRAFLFGAAEDLVPG